jgi:hypothetical protein
MEGFPGCGEAEPSDIAPSLVEELEFDEPQLLKNCDDITVWAGVMRAHLAEELKDLADEKAVST